MKAKVWRSISLLPTLDKALKIVIADRLSYVVEAHTLLPINYFRVKKQWFTEQVLMLLQERIYKVWRQRKVLSLISFDIKGVYNKMYKKRLLQRLCARHISSSLCWWVNAFCSDQTATLSVNRYDSKKQKLLQTGLQQGSLLFSILFFFFNANLVKKKIDSNREALTFVDNYTAWVTGFSAEANIKGIQRIISKATAWEQKSSVTFEREKIILIHFTRNDTCLSNTTVNIKRQKVQSVSHWSKAAWGGHE